MYFTRAPVFTRLYHRRALKRMKRFLCVKRRLALAMALYHRLGAGSWLSVLDVDILG